LLQFLLSERCDVVEEGCDVHRTTLAQRRRVHGDAVLAADVRSPKSERVCDPAFSINTATFGVDGTISVKTITPGEDEG
jgi:hypothetical protein